MLDARISRELLDTFLGPERKLLGKTIGVVIGGRFDPLPFEAFVTEPATESRPARFLADDCAIVRLRRPPLGAPTDLIPPPASKRGWLVVQDERAIPIPLGSDEIRTVRSTSIEEIRKAWSNCTHLLFDAAVPPADVLRDWKKLDAELVVLARVPGSDFMDALHARGVRDVVFPLRDPGPEERRFLADVCARVASGTSLLDAIPAARAAGTGPAWSWATWVVHRRS